MKRLARAVCLATAVPLALVGLGVTRAEAISDGFTQFTVPVSRLVNPKSDASLLTQFESESAGAAGFGFSPTTA